MHSEYPRKILNEYRSGFEDRVKYNTKFITDTINKYLNTKFYDYLGDKTLSQLGWVFEFFKNKPDDTTLGYSWFLGNYKNDKNHPHIIGINDIFITDMQENQVERVIKHEIAHSLGKYVKPRSIGHDKILYSICEDLWGDRSIGDPYTKTDVDRISKYAICFEPSIGCPDGKVKLVTHIPKNYFDIGYIYSTIVQINNNKILYELFPNEEESEIIKSLPIDMIRKSKMKATNYSTVTENITFKELYNIINEGKFSQIFKKAALVGSLMGAPLASQSLLSNTMDNVPISQQESPQPKDKQQFKDKFVVGTNGSEQWVLAATLYDEARGESLQGKEAVASVIWNRHKERKKTLKQICLQPYQFSGWNGKTKMPIDITNSKNRKAWEQCWEIAKNMVNGNFTPTINSNHYYNPKLANPKWGKQMKKVKVIGNHRFGKL